MNRKAIRTRHIYRILGLLLMAFLLAACNHSKPGEWEKESGKSTKAADETTKAPEENTKDADEKTEIDRNIQQFSGLVDDVEKEYCDEKGYVSEEAFDQLIEAVYEKVAVLPCVKTAQKDEYGISVKTQDGFTYVYNPLVEGVDSADDSFEVITLQPYYSDNQSERTNEDLEALDTVASNLSEKDSRWGFKDTDNLDDSNVSIQRILDLDRYKLILWHGHGGYNTIDGYFLCTTIQATDRLFEEYHELTKGNTVIQLGSGRVFLKPDFFNENFESDSFHNAFLYFATCLSGKEKTFADVFINKGAAVVFVNSETIYRKYNLDMLHLIVESFCLREKSPLVQVAMEEMDSWGRLYNKPYSWSLLECLTLAKTYFGEHDGHLKNSAEVYYVTRKDTEELTYLRWMDLLKGKKNQFSVLGHVLVDDGSYQYQYDADGLCISAQSEDGEVLTFSYEYDVDGRPVVRYLEEDGERYRIEEYEYDSSGRLRRLNLYDKDTENKAVWEYDEEGRAVSGKGIIYQAPMLPFFPWSDADLIEWDSYGRLLAISCPVKYSLDVLVQMALDPNASDETRKEYRAQLLGLMEANGIKADSDGLYVRDRVTEYYEYDDQDRITKYTICEEKSPVFNYIRTGKWQASEMRSEIEITYRKSAIAFSSKTSMYIDGELVDTRPQTEWEYAISYRDDGLPVKCGPLSTDIYDRLNCKVKHVTLGLFGVTWREGFFSYYGELHGGFAGVDLYNQRDYAANWSFQSMRIIGEGQNGETIEYDIWPDRFGRQWCQKYTNGLYTMRESDQIYPENANSYNIVIDEDEFNYKRITDED